MVSGLHYQDVTAAEFKLNDHLCSA